MEQQLSCSLCHNQYKQANPPRLLTMCGHTFCEKCIRGLIKKKQASTKFKIICPEDSLYLQLTTNKASFFPKNVALMNVIEAKKSMMKQSQKLSSSQNILDQLDQTTNQFLKELTFHTTTHSPNASIQNRKNSFQDQSNMCLLHQKALDIACIDDCTRICASCAIFGQHKGHLFKQIDEVQKVAKEKYEEILMIMNFKNKQEKKIQDQQVKKEAINIIRHKHSKLKKEVTSCCQKIVQKISMIEKNCFSNLQEIFKEAEYSITNILKVDENLMQQYNEWQANALKQLNSLEERYLQDKILTIYGKESKIQQTIEAGNIFYKKLKLKQSEIISNIQEAVESISIEFNQQKINILGDIVLVKNMKKQLSQNKYDKKQAFQIRNSFSRLLDQGAEEKWNAWKTKKNAFDVNQDNSLEESLLDIDEQDYRPQALRMTVACDSPLVKSDIKHVKSSKMIPIAISKLQLSPAPMTPKGTVNRSLRTNSEKHLKLKKISKVKIPQQYEKIYEGIKNNTVQNVDLTGADLGDQLMLYFLQGLGKQSKVKTLKCIRNKLTDSFMKSIIKKLVSVSTLNLAQNQLTERSLDLVLQSLKLQELPNLKSLVLSQNKIMERKVKQRVQRIKQMGIIVSL